MKGNIHKVQIKMIKGSVMHLGRTRMFHRITNDAYNLCLSIDLHNYNTLLLEEELGITKFRNGSFLGSFL
jgi:hypothetical protein